MKNDPCNTFDNPRMLYLSFQDMPNSDNITRRLKKLFLNMGKAAESKEGFTFENESNLKERTGLEIDEKNFIVQELMENGLPIAPEGKSEWTTLKDKLQNKMKAKGIKNKFDSKNVQFVERFVS